MLFTSGLLPGPRSLKTRLPRVEAGFFDIDARHSFCNLSSFTRNQSIAWMESALQPSVHPLHRQRLSVDQVLWLVLGMILSHREPVSEVARSSNIFPRRPEATQPRPGNGLARNRCCARSYAGLFRNTGTPEHREGSQTTVTHARNPSRIRPMFAYQQLIVMAAILSMPRTIARFQAQGGVGESVFRRAYM